MRKKFKILLLSFILFLNFNSNNLHSQIIVKNDCDTEIFSKVEFDKCKTDEVWKDDIVVNTNYIIKFKTSLLPKYRKLRKELRLPIELQNSLQQLKKTYDSVLVKKTSIFLIDMDKNQQYVQPKAYLSSLISLQTFNFYPDVYAILLNDIHLQLKPITSTEDLTNFNILIDNIFQAIPNELYKRLVEITTSFSNENAKLMKEGFSLLFQGKQSEKDIEKYRIINFLLWLEDV